MRQFFLINGNITFLTTTDFGDGKDYRMETIKTTFYGPMPAKSRSYIENYVLQMLGI